MWTVTPENVLDYLQATGRLSAETTTKVTPLAWGVSNIVLRIDPDNYPPLVIKQSQPQLRTRLEWKSRCERIFREADALRAWHSLLPVGAVPRVLFEDRPLFLLGLEAIQPDHVVWKQLLLQGELNPSIAQTLGQRMAQVHRGSWLRPELLPDAEDWSVFDELRIDPFYRWLMSSFAEVRQPLQELITNMSAHRFCLVHADFSPKNVLVHPQGIVLVDFETAHYGDPAFDLGFFLSHLLLKSLLHLQRSDAWQALIGAFWQAYQAEMRDHPVTEISQRAVGHLAACLWARLDGKSPVDYLEDSAQREFVRQIAYQWLKAPPRDLLDALDEYFRRAQA